MTNAFAESEALKQAEHEFQLKNFEIAFEKFKAIQADPYTAPSDLAFARCRLGIMYSIKDDQKQSRSHLELALGSDSLPATVTPLCFYALLQIYVMDKSFAEARDLMTRYPDPAFPALYKARIFALGAEIGRQLKDSQFESAQLERLLRVMEFSKQTSVELKILGDWVGSLNDFKRRQMEVVKQIDDARKQAAEEAKALNEKTNAARQSATSSAQNGVSEAKVSANNAGQRTEESQTPSAGEFDLFGPFKQLRAGNIESVLTQMQNNNAQILQRVYPNIPLDSIKERADQLLKDDPRQVRIGLLLPAGGGVFSRLQLRALKGVSAFLKSRAAREVEYQIFVKSAVNDAGGAETATTELVLKDKVHVIVGPFYGAQMVGASAVASFFGVPLFALGPVHSAQEYEAAFVFRMGTFAHSQARAQVNYLKQKNRKVVAVMSPADGYGVEMAKVFESVCKEQGLQVQRVEFVDESTEIFQEHVKALLGPQDAKLRGPEYAKLVSEARKKAAQEKRKFDPSVLKAPAYVPFQALYVPDSLDRVRLIANTFAFYDARSIRFLGDKTWLEAGGKQSVADQFLNGARVPVQRSGSFLPFLRKELAATDGVLDIERQTFDALLLTRTAQYRVGGNNPAKIAFALQNPEFNADGTGKYGPINAFGEPMSEFELGQYHNGNVINQGSAGLDSQDDEPVGEELLQ